MKEIKYTILFYVCENFCDFILLRFRFRYGKKLRFRFRFRFRNTTLYLCTYLLIVLFLAMRELSGIKLDLKAS
jgi:hypothetical protein